MSPALDTHSTTSRHIGQIVIGLALVVIITCGIALGGAAAATPHEGAGRATGVITSDLDPRMVRTEGDHLAIAAPQVLNDDTSALEITGADPTQASVTLTNGWDDQRDPALGPLAIAFTAIAALAFGATLAAPRKRALAEAAV